MKCRINFINNCRVWYISEFRSVRYDTKVIIIHTEGIEIIVKCLVAISFSFNCDNILSAKVVIEYFSIKFISSSENGSFKATLITLPFKTVAISSWSMLSILALNSLCNIKISLFSFKSLYNLHVAKYERTFNICKDEVKRKKKLMKNTRYYFTKAIKYLNENKNVFDYSKPKQRFKQ